MADIVATAEQLADDLLFPRALATDRSDAVPVDLLDALAQAGLYGLSGPVDAGGLQADFSTVCAVGEALASGCLSTAFVWGQHVGVVIAAAQSANEHMHEWLGPLCRGERRAGLALGGAVPGPAFLRASLTDGGWRFDGTSLFVSGWGMVDAIHTAARTDDDRLVWALLDARECGTLKAKRLELVALDATATVRVTFRDHPVPPERVTSVVRHQEGVTPPHVLRIHASFALGVTRRCCRLLGETPLDDELARLRADLVPLAQLPAKARVVEIGCGTGQATLPLAERGYAITCVELGEQLAAVAQRKLAGFPEVKVVTANFEAWQPDRAEFDAIVAFTAF